MFVGSLRKQDFTVKNGEGKIEVEKGLVYRIKSRLSLNFYLVNLNIKTYNIHINQIKIF